MSHYENYSDTSANYDYTRVPVGVEIIGGCLAQGELPQQHVLDALMQGEAYRHCRGPLSKQWRDGDSIRNTVSAEKIDQICVQLEALDRTGELGNFMYKNDSRRQHIGQLSFLYGRRE